MLGSMGYQFCAVLMQRSLCNTESILTQLFFEYSLKMRVKADGPDKEAQASSNGTTAKTSNASFIGKLTNLITIDLESLMAAREFFQFCRCSSLYCYVIGAIHHTPLSLGYAFPDHWRFHLPLHVA